jgi:hypoxanthine phosphoribosyltransferase
MQTDSTTSTTAERAEDQVPCLIPAARLTQRVQELASEISTDYAEKSLLVVGVLHGAYVFMADLVRQLKIPVRCAFVMVSTYGDDTVSSGQVKLRLDVTQPVEGEHVLLVDDIVDTGISVDWLLNHIKRRDPASLRLCALLDKPARRRVPVEIDYLGFEIPDHFVVGYGIDCAGRYRDLPYVGHVPTDE